MIIHNLKFRNLQKKSVLIFNPWRYVKKWKHFVEWMWKNILYIFLSFIEFYEWELKIIK